MSQTQILQREWKPSPKQIKFIELPDTIFEGMYGGAAGGGKSEVLLMLPLIRRFYENPYFKGILFRRTFPELEKSLILRSHEFYPSTGATYNSQNRRWRFPSGAIVDFGYSEFENDVRRYDTTEYNYMGFDELTSFTEFQYTYLTSRCRTSRIDLPAIIRSATNPGNIGHSWVRRRFVEPAIGGLKILLDPVTKTKRIFVPAKLTDNPYLMTADPDYLNRLELLPEAEKRAKRDGDWWTFIGQVFDDWRVNPFPGEPKNARHVIMPFQVPSFWPIILTIDWGFSAMLWAGWLAVSPDGRIYLIKEYWGYKLKNSTWSSDVARISQNMNIKAVVLGRDCWNQKGDEKTIADQFQEYSGMVPERADTDRLGGKTLLQEYIRWRQKPESFRPPEDYDADLAAKVLRMQGLESYKSYMARFVAEQPEMNLPRLQVFNTCEKLTECIPLCIYPAIGSAASKQDQEDVMEFDGDDPYDGLRYGIKRVDKYIKECQAEFEDLQRVQKIVDAYNKDNNMTDYYNRMRILEARDISHVKSIRRYHERPRMVQ